MSIPMPCMACGSEMILVNVVQDDTAAVPGFEHHTFKCSECHDVERSLVFTKHGRQNDAAPIPVHAAPPIVPAPAVQVDAGAGPGLFRRIVAKIRSR
jgi:hypothetical protein